VFKDKLDCMLAAWEAQFEKGEEIMSLFEKHSLTTDIPIKHCKELRVTLAENWKSLL